MLDESIGKTRKHGHYQHYTVIEKARVAAECAITSTMRYFAPEFSDRSLNESTVRVWVKQDTKELLLRNNEGKTLDIRISHPLKITGQMKQPQKVTFQHFASFHYSKEFFLKACSTVPCSCVF